MTVEEELQRLTIEAMKCALCGHEQRLIEISERVALLWAMKRHTAMEEQR